MSSSEDKTTVYVAMGANILIAVAKLFAGIISHSSALLAETAHSIADTMNQVFLRISLSLGGRPPDEEHPFGYGKERFFWAFMAAIFIFVSGAVFSVADGLYRLLFSSAEQGSEFVAYLVLGVAFVAEGTSLVRAARQVRGEAAEAGQPFLRYIGMSKDPTVKTVLLEDSAAVVGVVLATAGVLLHSLTGHRYWDAGASVAIGLLLAFVAYRLGTDTKGLLLGKAATPDERERMRRTILAHEEISQVRQLLTMYVGPDSVLVAARVALRDGLDADAVEDLADRIDRDLRREIPQITEVFVDPTPEAATRRRDG
ncbi:MAG TPA: cation diffusion facilitator family transporter [Actinomycetota bacterium]|jgi:cation diffusion facilitator family transporter|nr:cation diffusion facilitator family transporter [Actinomycetota bacterium]